MGVMSATAMAADLEPVTITATRNIEPVFEVAASVSSQPLRTESLGVNLSESLGNVPGLLARDRQNYAQDTQISVRGFGARSAFGIRGVRLYVDGVPATQPDGQGQVSHFNLATAERVEVLRGPFSALYGNSSGGVIQLFTADGTGPGIVTAGAATGSFAARRFNLGAAGENGRLHYNTGFMHFRTDGFRDHSAAERDSLQLKLSHDFRDADRLTLLYNDFDAPDAQDPLGLTRAQYDANASQAAPVALQFNTRKSAAQRQGAVIHDIALGDRQTLRVMGYVGQRSVLQFLAIPTATQANPAHSGGVVDLDTHYDGGELRWSSNFDPVGRPLQVVAGIAYDGLQQQRRGFENFIGASLGVVGALRRDEQNRVHTFDQYLQLDWDLAQDWSLQAGVRHSAVRFSSADAYIRTGNADDSGTASYDATTPVAGVLWHARPTLNLYAAAGRSFETPTFAELAYRLGGGGLNFGLEAARGRNAEVGAKWRPSAAAHVDAALFRADTEDELVIIANSGGRSVYGNAGRTRREGFELSAGWNPLPRLQLQLAHTQLNARVRDSYSTCTGTPCTTPNAIVRSGNRIPGVPDANSYGAVSWMVAAGLRLSLEARYIAAVPVDDLNSAEAPAYATVDSGVSRAWNTATGRINGYLRVDNLLDRRYVGSIIVNDANGRFYEPGPGRTLLVGFSYASN